MAADRAANRQGKCDFIYRICRINRIPLTQLKMARWCLTERERLHGTSYASFYPVPA